MAPRPDHDGPLSALRAAARDRGWDDSPADRAFLREVADRLGDRPRPLVAVLHAVPPSDVAAVLAAACPRARVHEYDATKPAERLHLEMALAGRFQLVVDDTRTAAGRGELLRRVFFHLRPGGSLVVRDHRAGAADLPDDEEEGSLASTVARLVRTRLADETLAKSGAKRDRQVLARSVDTWSVGARHLVATNHVRAWAKVREEDVAEVLAVRRSAGRVVEHRPGLEFESRCVVRESPSDLPMTWPTRFDVPAVELREYRDALCVPGQVATSGNLLMPDSFRHNQKARLKNRHLEDLAPGFAALPRGADREPERWPGAYYYLDSEFRGHFGHLVTEQLSRMWAWREAKAAEPDLKALLMVNDRTEVAHYELELFAAAGVDPADVVLARGPVQVERLYAPTPMFSQPAYVHPDIADTWREVSDRLAAGAPDRDYPRRFFCARRIGKRPCRNAGEVERLFADHGFEVLYPEDYPLAEQARLFREADAVGGFAGSALFNLCLSTRPQSVVMVSSESYRAKNEYLVAAVHGHRLDVAWCRPEVPMPQGRWSKRAFHSPYTFDHDREGRFVSEVLRDL